MSGYSHSSPSDVLDDNVSDSSLLEDDVAQMQADQWPSHAAERAAARERQVAADAAAREQQVAAAAAARERKVAADAIASLRGMHVSPLSLI